MSKVICLWASPRNISTALMYSFAQREDTSVLDEPFYAYYLTHVNPSADHPGKEEIINSQSSNFSKIVAKMDEFKDKNILPLFIDNPCKKITFTASNQEMPGLLIYRKTDKPVTLTSTNPLLIDLFYSNN